MLTDKRIWRTDDGQLVHEGHPDAAFLAYAAGDQIPDDIAKGLNVKTPAENKAQVPTENKGSGLTIDDRDSVIRALEDLGHKVDRRKSTDTLRAEINEARAAAAPALGVGMDDDDTEPSDEGAGDEEE